MEQLFDLSTSPHKNFLESQNQIWEVIKNLDDYINELFKNPPEGFALKDNLLVGKNVVLNDSVKVKGKAVLGENTEISDNVLLRDGVIIGCNSFVGLGIEVKHSLIMDFTRIPHLNYIADSVIGNHVNFGAGAITTNWKGGYNNLEISTSSNGNKTNTGLEKLGSIVGDSVYLGANVVLSPGTIIGKNSLIYPLSLIRGTVPDNKIVKNRPSLEIVDKE